jgi:glycosyltransferase family protein
MQMSNSKGTAKPKKRYFQRLRRWTGFDAVLVKIRRYLREKVRAKIKKALDIEDVNLVAYNLLYEMADVIQNNRQLLIPRIASHEETLEELLNTERSFTRFGDGELGMMFFVGDQLGFQQYDASMIERLKEVLASDEPDLMVGLKNMFGMQGPICDLRASVGRLRDLVNPFLDAKKQYYDAGVTRTHKPEHFLKLKQIWEGKKIVTIEGSMCRLGVGNDLFDNVASLRRILAPAECAFSAYDRILAEALKIEKDALFLIALGPTATILAHDLCKSGYRAIDIGHLDICYELFLRGEQHMVAIEGKYVNEASYRSPAPCTDPVYLSQIITEVKLN